MATHRTLTTVTDVIDKLGGYEEVCHLTGRKYKAVWMWPYLGKFPANTYVIIKGALADKGLKAKDDLWGMASAKEHTG